MGHRIDGCAFVYGSLSFLDKVTSGVCLFAIEAFNGEHQRGHLSQLCMASLAGQAWGLQARSVLQRQAHFWDVRQSPPILRGLPCTCLPCFLLVR